MSNYEESYEELKKIQKGLGSKNLNINFEKLDDITKEELRSSILNIINKRKNEVFSNIQNSTNNNWF